MSEVSEKMHVSGEALWAAEKKIYLRREDAPDFLSKNKQAGLALDRHREALHALAGGEDSARDLSELLAGDAREAIDLLSEAFGCEARMLRTGRLGRSRLSRTRPKSLEGLMVDFMLRMRGNAD